MRHAKTWLITDTHWNAANMEWANRPPNFKQLLTGSLKQYVMPQDTLIHLGDVIFKNVKELPELLAAAPCTKILVRGNHDKETNNWYKRHGFDFVCDGMLLDRCWLTHKPTVCPPEADVNIHGHFHNNPPERWEGQLFDIYHSGPHALLSIEIVKYKPICMHKIRDIWLKRGNYVVSASD